MPPANVPKGPRMNDNTIDEVELSGSAYTACRSRHSPGAATATATPATPSPRPRGVTRNEPSPVRQPRRGPGRRPLPCREGRHLGDRAPPRRRRPPRLHERRGGRPDGPQVQAAFDGRQRHEGKAPPGQPALVGLRVAPLPSTLIGRLPIFR